MKKKYEEDYRNMDFLALRELIDDGTEVIYINTPKDWKCSKRGCKTNFKHTHSIFNALRPNINNKLDK